MSQALSDGVPRTDNLSCSLALHGVAGDEVAPAFLEAATKVCARRAASMAALLFDILLELENGSGLFGDELLDRRVPRCQ
jgi:hypothetical protein